MSRSFLRRLRVQGLVRCSDSLSWEHQAVDQKEYLLAAEELLQDVAPVALCELLECDLL